MAQRPLTVAGPIIVFALGCAVAAAQAQEGKFDGAWNVTMTCPPHIDADDDAKGYTHRFAAEVQKSRIRGTHGKEGEPGWHFLHGRIDEDGSATLRLDGIVNNPRYAINEAERGKATPTASRRSSSRAAAQVNASRGARASSSSPDRRTVAHSASRPRWTMRREPRVGCRGHP